MTDDDRQLITALEQAEKYIIATVSQTGNTPSIVMGEEGHRILALIRAALLDTRFYSQPDFMGSLNVTRKEYWK